MNILIIEDNDSKRIEIELVIIEELKDTNNKPVFNYATNLVFARREICTQVFDLIIFDMFLPVGSNDDREVDCSEELISEFSVSKNYQTEAIALTQFEISEIDNFQSFNSAGITVVHFNESKSWITALKQKVVRASQKIKCDFLIFCALTKERNAFSEAECLLGKQKNISGMNCMEISIDGKNGFIVKPHGMGLVNMAIVASKAIELFQPKIVAMSGICAGVKGESNYLDIVVGKTCWEYQTGKWKDGVFKQEPYQSSLLRRLEVDLEQSSEDSDILNEIRKNIFKDELSNMRILIAPVSSGSAVIADEKMMESIGMQHRKMAALEMEMYSLYEAAAQSLCQPLCFGAKAVVDLGDNHKGDGYHDPACKISARYVTLMINRQFRSSIN
ncbi:hypothetical protein [Serratia liquefaciens]|uniref:5'-methylthioadenosine/S-adenosylhomocysteine nucleosidase family protein n=1 Tax=Serratia liquefaciens TaxID=614 RepID=UPI003525FF5B